MPLAANTTIRGDLPPQVGEEFYTFNMPPRVDVGYAFVLFFLLLLFSKYLAYFWSMIHCLQIISHLAMFSVYFPPAALVFFSAVKDASNFDFIPRSVNEFFFSH